MCSLEAFFGKKILLQYVFLFIKINEYNHIVEAMLKHEYCNIKYNTQERRSIGLKSLCLPVCSV